jgi:putative transposase
MRTSQYYRLAHHVQEQTTVLVQRLLRPADYSQRCTAWALLSSLVLAAASKLSLAAVAALRPGSPCRETLRQALLQTLPEYAELRRRVAQLLRASLPRRLSQRGARRRYPMAIDLHDVPYYKRQRTPPEHVRKGKPVPGTRYRHQYATASLLLKGQYFVVALTPFDPDDDLAALVRRLLQQASRLGFSPRCVLLDRTFWSTEVFRYLQHAGYPFLIPVLARGKKPTTAGGPTGTRVFLHGCTTGRYTYRITNPRSKHTATVTIVVQRRNQAGHNGKHGRYAWAYALWRMNLSAIVWVRQSYRRRFRIESSYRLLEAARGRTSSRNEGWRLWYVVLGILLLNGWLELRRQASRSTAKAVSEWTYWNRLLVALAYLLLLEPAPLGTNPTGLEQRQNQ